MPALAMRILRGPWWDTASEMHFWMDGSEVMSPVTVKRLGCGGMLGMGLRSWAVTLAP